MILKQRGALNSRCLIGTYVTLVQLQGASNKKAGLPTGRGRMYSAVPHKIHTGDSYPVSAVAGITLAIVRWRSPHHSRCGEC